MISKGVKAFLERSHSGALMISGGWGSGKSYFVKNTLLKEIKEIDLPNEQAVDQSAVTEKLRNLLDKASSDLCKKYYPVVTSVFGKTRIEDFSNEIVVNWMDSVSNGFVKKGRLFLERAVNVVKGSKKINDWIDLNTLLDYKPGVSALPRNTVIILDDLERLCVEESEILGFVNNLSENLGFKVIVVCNEEYLDKIGGRLLDFKEKVVEKTLKFRPDTIAVVKSIAEGYGDALFTTFISRPEIMESISSASAKSIYFPEHAKAIINLRTLKFALSHFKGLYNKVVGIKEDRELSDEELDETLVNLWYEVLALTLELKSGRIGCENIHSLDDKEYVDTASSPDKSNGMAFHALNLYHINASDKDRERPEKLDDTDYASDFFQFYFRSREVESLHPILSKSVLYYVVYGEDVDGGDIIDELRTQKDILYPKYEITLADKDLSAIMTGFSEMDNNTISSLINNIVTDVDERKGEAFTALEGYINAMVYVSGFSELIELADEKIYKIFETGVDAWMRDHKVSSILESRLEMMMRSVEDKYAKDLLRHAMARVDQYIELEHTEEKKALIAMFMEDTPKFCLEICPQSAGNGVYHIPYYGSVTLLDEIPEQDIEKKIMDLQVRDIYALDSLFTHRYRHDSENKMRDKETVFWQSLKTNYDRIAKSEKNAALLLFGKILTPKLNEVG